MPDVDFDLSRATRTDGFVINGERFGIQAVSFEDVANYQDAPVKDKQTEANAETVEFIEAFIVPDDKERWKELAARKTNPLTTGDILGIARALMEIHSERPTIQPSSSGRGPVRLPTGSAAEQPSRASGG